LDRDILEIAGPDMPFLVDSVMGELADQGISALAMFHPLAPSTSGKGRDSLIQVHLPRLSVQRAKAVLDGVRATLADVRESVVDFSAMRQRMLDAAEELEKSKSNAAPSDVAEGVALLRWLAADKFTFLGARDYKYLRDDKGQLTPHEPDILNESCLGILRDTERYVLRTSAEPMMLTPELKRLVSEPTPLIVAKSTLRSRVHRRAAADYISVKRYNDQGEAVGEIRFVGLFTSESFTEATRNIPVLRRKAEWVLHQTGFAPGGHNAKTLRKIIEYYPREELWQMSREELLETSRGILHLLDRPRPRVFTRRDRFNRFVTALVYVPKDRYDTKLREALGGAIAKLYGGEIESFQPQLGEAQLARVLFVIGEIDKKRPEPDPRVLDATVTSLARTWEDSFEQELMRSALFDSAAREEAANRFVNTFTAAYRERYPVQEALIDTAEIMRAGDDEVIRARVYRLPTDAENIMRCKFYARGDVLALSATVPILENMGLFVDSELNYELQLKAVALHPAQRVFIHEIETRSADGKPIDLARAGHAFEEAFAAVWTGKAESDGFNRLILTLS
ncbi:MAG: NAD-glutamate dehydrogenase, partial [Hyphomonadaceae bacterium]|nr:NAD-glutamate dehydrogenase [Hyphomonadaceae bacterium]